ncbi:3-hydroxyacyl-CoA dehydrogenase [Anaerovirgula multivorans]|uniref:3-hydroxybutyryl-CoA dehydrogenase n=1 Tax=Anaerovirgula multivorans TaxID=312168 RepID=A0A239J5R3_9FIRM|nr:3-hydroxyacyl-CoA dehydrogenase family protein [Anaerovirgula multivorans]SNT01160.1 3-hydroxyacyl-CoA dehydrogenase [Anaerovirgula multivorans]
MKVNNIAVIGHGLMGRGIIHTLAKSGFQVIAIKRRDDDHRLEEYFEKEIEQGRISQAECDQIWSRVKVTTDLIKAAECQLIIESINEDPDAKKELFARLGEICPEETVFATNTSTIPIGKLGVAGGRLDKMIGLHFMWPVPEMKLVEVIKNQDTSEETISLTTNLVKDMEKVPVVVKDSPGFVSSRLIAVLINEAAEIYSQGIADAEAIDTIARLGLGFPAGPLRLCDKIGLDIIVDAFDNLFYHFREKKYAVSPVIRTMTESGYYGKKNGKGFYRYKK